MLAGVKFHFAAPSTPTPSTDTTRKRPAEPAADAEKPLEGPNMTGATMFPGQATAQDLGSRGMAAMLGLDMSVDTSATTGLFPLNDLPFAPRPMSLTPNIRELVGEWGTTSPEFPFDFATSSDF